MSICLSEEDPIHGEIIDAIDNPLEWIVIAMENDLHKTPHIPSHQKGFCVKCHKPFRWSVEKQQWKEWNEENTQA